ncbi:MAG: hypothetical protein EOO06_02900 [Chitinophagaceae bacterium]|nr:MAG: hypothetical protein EOO06_02900 [Chitinophagaceae bacterium]
MNAILQFSTQAPERNNENSFAENIQAGFSYLKDGLNAAIDKTADSFHSRFATPVNNFIKDFGQIEKEFQSAQETSQVFRICLNGTYVPASDVLNMPMEENY